jgi:ribosomal protein S18 acetylase RimI-like enzyme
MSVDKKLIACLKVEPLDRKMHDRAAFSCGVERIDNFLKITAGKHADEDHGKVYVACQADSNVVVGFYAISPHAIDMTVLPENDRKRLPRHPTVSAIYLSMVAVATSLQGCGIGTFLMAEALKKCIEGADIMGGHFVVLDAINEDAARMYRKVGFVEIPSQPGRMLISLRAVRKAIEKARASTAQPAVS